MANTHLVDITPDTKLMPHLGMSGHTLIAALAELCDNSLDSFLTNPAAFKKLGQKKVTVKIEYTTGTNPWIKVTDDAYGMTREELKDALTLARTKKRDELGGRLIGKFGLGLKTAASALAKKWKVITNQPDADSVLTMEYNEDEFVKTQEWTVPIVPSKRPNGRQHGTELLLQDLKKRPQAKSYIINSLSPIFDFYIREGLLEILVQGDPVPAREWQLLSDDNWQSLSKKAREHVPDIKERMRDAGISENGRRPINLRIGNKRVTGWAGLLLESSQKGNYGFTLIRHKRIVKANEKIGIYHHPALARIVGELHLDDWEVNNRKDDFIRDTPEWSELTGLGELDEAKQRRRPNGLLGEEINKIIRLSRALASSVEKKVPVSEQRTNQQLLATVHQDDVLSTIEETAMEDTFQAASQRQGKLRDQTVATQAALAEAKREVRKAHVELAGIRIELVQWGRPGRYVSWETERNPKGKLDLVVNINTDHPFYAALSEQDQKLYRAFLVCECLSKYVFSQSPAFETLDACMDNYLRVYADIVAKKIRSGATSIEAPAI